MKEPSRPSSGGASSSELPSAPLDVAVVGAGRVGCSLGRALLARGHRIVAASVASRDSAGRVVDA
ncbi:MAG: oxidoreductase, partial [Actinomycetota bacterium]